MYRAEALFNTKLSSDITASDTTITVDDINKLPDDYPNIATLIDSESELIETIEYTGKDGSSLTGVTRAVEGTAQDWSQGTDVGRFYTAIDQNLMIDEINGHIGSTGDTHGAVTTDVNGFMTSQDKTNLDNIQEEYTSQEAVSEIYLWGGLV
jgi:hypothetical protein